MTPSQVTATAPDSPLCAGCGKPPALCVCAALAKVDNRIEVLVLRHPQEQDEILGTAGLLCRQLSRATLLTGLSWANLPKALGGRAADPRDWGTLYLGTKVQSQGADAPPLSVADAIGEPLADQRGGLEGIRGLILLDGTWAQAKALWWRNAWLLKTRRLLINPSSPSLYGAQRREPRRESVSTLEAAAQALAVLERRPAIVASLVAPLKLLVRKIESTGAAARPAPRRLDRRKRR